MAEHEDAAPPADPAPEDARARLEGELAAAREEIERYRDRWMRERADLENYKKRAERERSEAVRFGTERLVSDLLGVLDDLERAIRAAESGASGTPLLDGVRLVEKAFRDVLARHGVTRVPAHGHAFDPAHHEAIAHIESDEHESGIVVEEHRGGYRLHERLLRPALVSVSKGSGGRNDLAKPEGRD
ncbi:MAG TPA: nucleotide exchange factor GrpE [Candidatus Limnocylindria bacterium]|nr:nucleotide exchange factor GrpE [Candidatus Limnocylindria bacterium]